MEDQTKEIKTNNHSDTIFWKKNMRCKRTLSIEKWPDSRSRSGPILDREVARFSIEKWPDHYVLGGPNPHIYNQ